jgi:cell division protein FtsQ
MSARLLESGQELERQGSVPSPGRRRASGVLFMLTLATLLAAGGFWTTNPRTLPIRHVHVSGEFHHLSADAMQRIAGSAVRGGFFSLNVETVRSELLREPWVSGVTVRRVWPDGVSLEVIEQVPLARWGDDGLLNAAGAVFHPHPDTIPHSLPQLSGPSGTQKLMLERYQHMQRVLAPHNVVIARLLLNERRAWSFVIENGPLVILGRRQVMERFDRFTAAVPAYLGDELQRIDTLDMRYTNGFSVRWKQERLDESTERQADHG